MDDIVSIKKRTYFDRLGKYCALRLEFMNLLPNFHFAVNAIVGMY